MITDYPVIKYNKAPMEIKIPVPNGSYEVTVTVKAAEDAVFSILAQSRRFMIENEYIKSGEKKDFTFAVNVCDRKFDGCEYENVSGVEIYVLCDNAIEAIAMVSPVKMPVIYICGDSTVTDQSAEYPYNPQSTYCGWGQKFPMLLDEKIAVSNHAQSGSCTKAFIENNWTAFKDKISEGDMLIIEFGHNDQKIEELDAFGGYTKNLEYFVNFALERKARPVICSPINRIIFEENGHLKNLLGDYRNAAKAVSEKYGIPFIDLWSLTTSFFEAAGPVKSWYFFYGDNEKRDYTHTNDIGGGVVAKFVAAEMLRQEIEPVYTHINEDLLEIVQVFAEEGEKPDNAAELAHLKTIGLKNVPSELSDIDAEI